MPVDPAATIEITAFSWVPPFAQGYVRDLRPRWACEEMGLAYRERLISASKRPEWYYAEQPWGQVPSLRDGDIAMFESGATLIHLGEKGGLLPADGQARATALSWLLATFASLEPLLLQLPEVELFARNEEWARLREPSLTKAIGKRLDRLATALGDKEWLGATFSIADIAMVTSLRNMGDNPLLSERPGLAAYVARGTARPAFQRALDAQLAAFAANEPQPAEGA